ncbi:KpsF/GutQ family sugar-phosphate isomerase [bacterium]|nr:KpsF/GutQ family sugar-phosphate isomerase [bacterium]
MDLDLLASASRRANHMSQSLQQLSHQLQSIEQFRNTFLAVVELVCGCRIPNAAESVDSSRALSNPQTVHFVAVGKSGGVAQVVVSMLASVGIQARFLHPTEALHGDLGSVVRHDPVLLISNNGRSAELLAVIPLLRERGCKLVALTGRPDSPLAQACDLILQMPVQGEACPLNQAPLTSTVTTLALGQLLVAASMEKRLYDLDSYARNHPGGAIGKRIFVRVDDLMVGGKFLPRITSTESFKKCISRMTECALGALLVVDENDVLQGFIGERDLRVAMEARGPAVFDAVVSEIMNAKPVTLKAGTLAIEAIQIMENRPRPLNSLPIVDEHGKAVGLLRLHDLVAAGISSSI